MVDASTPATSRPWWALVVAVVSLAMALSLLALGTAEVAAEGDDDHTAMLAVAPAGVVELASLPADQVEVYEAAAADPEAFSAVRCYCGCESFLGHEDLLACFVRADGRWERHATGCAVCIAEARQVMDDRSEGLPLAEIVRRIDDRYSVITEYAAAPF